jgi:glutamyl-tRNA synthetase
MPDVVLKTTTIKEGISDGKYTGWSDVQLGTLQALAKRGIQPEAIRKYWLDVGIKEVDIEFSWKNLYSFNKEIIDQSSNRYFFVWDPVILKIVGTDTLTGKAPKHPDFKEKGTRDYQLRALEDKSGHEPGIFIFVTRSDISDTEPNPKLRLKDLCNIEIINKNLQDISVAKYIGTDLELIKQGVKIIHWTPKMDSWPITIHMPDGTKKKGYCEKVTKEAVGEIVQFERFGFVKLEMVSDNDTEMIGWFLHK